jgi:hypothetical protein
MKIISRLKKIASTGSYYHATDSVETLKKIISSGALVPNASENGVGPVAQEHHKENVENGAEDNFTGYVFVSDDLYYGARLFGDSGDEPLPVLEMSLNSDDLEQDKDTVGDTHSFTFKGEISSDHFKMIHILDRDTLNPLVSAGLNNWEEKYEEYLNTGETFGELADVVKEIEAYDGEYIGPNHVESVSGVFGENDIGGAYFRDVKLSDVKKLVSETNLYGFFDESGSIPMTSGVDFVDGSGIKFSYDMNSNVMNLIFEDDDLPELLDWFSTNRSIFDLVFGSVSSTMKIVNEYSGKKFKSIDTFLRSSKKKSKTIKPKELSDEEIMQNLINIGYNIVDDLIEVQSTPQQIYDDIKKLSPEPSPALTWPEFLIDNVGKLYFRYGIRAMSRQVPLMLKLGTEGSSLSVESADRTKKIADSVNSIYSSNPNFVDDLISKLGDVSLMCYDDSLSGVNTFSELKQYLIDNSQTTAKVKFKRLIVK